MGWEYQDDMARQLAKMARASDRIALALEGIQKQLADQQPVQVQVTLDSAVVAQTAARAIADKLRMEFATQVAETKDLSIEQPVEDTQEGDGRTFRRVFGQAD